jgi:ATP-dependent helicase/DNAse subunit B
MHIKEKKILLANCSDKNFKEAEKILFNIAREKIDRVGFTSPSSFFEREKIFGINGKKINSILYQFLLVECRPETGFRPEYFEHAFGNLSGDSDQTLKINNIKVRGKVDRIDINKQDRTFKVVDYKLSGKKPSKEDLLSGLSLQLPLYMYVSKIFIEAELSDQLNPLAAEIYSLKLTQKDFGRKAISIEAKKNISDKERIRMNEEIIKIASDSIKRYVNQIANGDFRLSQLKDRENKICSYCELKSICRIRDVN